MSEIRKYVITLRGTVERNEGDSIVKLLPGCQVVEDFDYDVLQAKVRELEERLGEVEAGRECVHIDEYQALQDRVHELEAKLRQVAQWVERESCGASLPSDPIEAIILIADERGKQVDRLNEKLERDQLRARVGELEEALRHIAEARWSPRTTASYDEDARYAYPERESYVRQYAQRALKGKEEHGI